MLSFQPISIEDRSIFIKYFSLRQTQNCDYNFSNIFSWRDFYQTEWCLSDGFLLIRFQINGKKNTGYMEPLGNGNLSAILRQLQEDAHQHQQPLRFFTLSEQFVKKLETTDFYRKMYLYSNRNFFDYLYSTHDLATLRGKKLQAKRNHIHQFQHAYPDYRWESLRPSLLDDALQILLQWENTEAPTPQIMSEKAMIITALQHFETLQLRGGILYVEQQPVAFTFGSELRNDTFCCHVEKADVRYEGAFAMINYLFANDLYSRYAFINREEDLGLENLRKAKQSYHPVMMEEKMEAIEINSIDYQIMSLWKSCFDDEDCYIAAYLHNYFNRQHAILLHHEKSLIGMFHPHIFNTVLGRVGYLFALAVQPDQQHRGLGSQIIQQALLQQSESLFLTTLITYSESLVSYYQRFGFADIHQNTCRMKTADGFDFGIDDAENIHFLYRIVSVQKYLQIYAAHHPDCSEQHCVHDEVIESNNGSFIMNNGKVTFSKEVSSSALNMEQIFLLFPLTVNEMVFLE
ncbi:MAG: GNAT family N-acetyltransferase [Bacteroidales bacterium]|nr:GNAT family N-acetyltransferase [Bacteroidales bacterium]